MSTREQTKDIPSLSRAATIQPASLDEEKRTVNVVWTTGARVMRGFFDRFWEELSLDPKHVRMDRLNSGAPLLNAHNDGDLGDVIGVVDSARLDGKEGTAVVRFAKAADDPGADAIFRKVRDGIIRNVSVGYRVHKMEKVEEQDDKIPVYRAVDWEPYEISMVPMGADAGAGVRSADENRSTNKCVFSTQQERAMPDGLPPTTIPAEPKPSAAVEATRAASAARIEDAKLMAEERQKAAEAATAAERTRSTEIRKLAKRAKLGEDWALKLIEAGTTVDEARIVVLNQLAADEEKDPFDGTTRIGAGDDESEKFIRGASAWLWQRTGTRGIIEAAKKKDPDMFKDVVFDPGEFRGYTAAELARLSLERRGVSTRGMDRMRMIGLAFTHRQIYQTIGDFPTLLENVLSKVLLGAYATQTNTWERFCKSEDVADFRVSNRYRTGSFTGLDVIPEHGEYKTGVIPDGSKYPISTQRLGKMFGLSQETIVNDDMGALTDQARQLGQAAMRTIENSVFALLALNSGLGPTQADAQPFFHSNRANVNATGSALSVAGIDADRVVMRSQKDPAGLDYLDLNPSVLLVPESLNGLGKEINDAQWDFDNAGTNTTGKFMRPNRVRGLFNDVVSSVRLTGTRRYLIANTMDMIVVAFLAGYGRGPVLDSQTGWRIEGVEWKVSIYAKAQMGDPKAAVTNAGV